MPIKTLHITNAWHDASSRIRAFYRALFEAANRLQPRGGMPRSDRNRGALNAMNHLIAANLRHHPGRTLASIVGVSIGVVLVLLTVGLVRGMLRDRGRRDAGLGVELMLSLKEQQGIAVTALPLAMPIEWKGKIAAVPGVAAVAAIGQHLEMKGGSGLGLRQIEGVDFESYRRATNVHIVEGRALPDRGDFLVVDARYAAAHKTRPGDRIAMIDREFTVTGIFEPETGARMMIPLPTMQDILGARDKCSMLLVKCATSSQQELVAARIAEQFPQFRILFTRDLPKLFAEGYSAFNVFLNVVAGLAVAISLLVIMLTMYTTVTERTRQIGILKSLGASRRFVAAVFLKESLAISLLGVALGIGVSIFIRYLMVYGFGSHLDIEIDYLLIASLGGILSGLLGALYPALRAAGQDVVETLKYE